MFDDSNGTLTNKECIEVLFKEYDTLRAEIIARTTGGFQLISVVALLTSALLAWAGLHAASAVLWIAMAIIVSAALLFAYATHREIIRLARRVRDLESEINQLSGTTLLKWESKFGAVTTGWVIKRRQD